jgi:hypothetical protein
VVFVSAAVAAACCDVPQAVIHREGAVCERPVSFEATIAIGMTRMRTKG